MPTVEDPLPEGGPQNPTIPDSSTDAGPWGWIPPWLRTILRICLDNWFILLAFACIGALRIYHCCQLTSNTGDSVRHLCWGLIVNEHGYGAISQSLTHFSGGLDFVVWSSLPYNYPVGALLFDQMCAAVWPTVFFAKLALTLIELGNSLLVYRLTRNRLLAFVYWASPLSIWWVSHEGQFEPLQSFFVLLALVLFTSSSKKSLAWFVLGLGIQVKLSAVFLLPLFALQCGSWRALLRGGAFLLVSFVPSLLLLLAVDPLALVTQSLALQYNPYYFNFLDQEMFLWNPTWMIISNQVVSYAFLGVLLWIGIARKQWREVLPAFLFLIFLKTVTNAQFWYCLVLPPFLLTIKDEKLRNVLFIAAMLLDVRALLQLLFGPFGWMVPHYYDSFAMGVFTNVGTLL